MTCSLVEEVQKENLKPYVTGSLNNKVVKDLMTSFMHKLRSERFLYKETRNCSKSELCSNFIV